MMKAQRGALAKAIWKRQSDERMSIRLSACARARTAARVDVGHEGPGGTREADGIVFWCCVRHKTKEAAGYAARSHISC